MKTPFSPQLAVLAAALLSALAPHPRATAAIFEQQAVDQSQFIAIARPYGNNQYDLLIIEQIPGQRECWSESGSNPTLIEPLLLNFDFTGSCERSTDSNGYSIRIDGQDYGLDYLLRIVERNGELVLVGTNRSNPSAPEIFIGRTYGFSSGFMKIHLNPGWQFAKRSYQGKILGHVYLTGESQALTPPPAAITNATIEPTNPAVPPDEPSPPSSSDNREYTFTAPGSLSDNSFEQSSAPPTSSFNAPSSFSEPNFAKNNDNFNAASTPTTGELPPPPTLNPIAPPTNNSDSQVVPPPPVATNSDRQTLSGVLGTLNGITPPQVAQNSLAGTYKVLVEARNSSQQQQVRSLYPDAFPTSHHGRPVWQVGVFSSQDKAETVAQSLRNVGLNPTVTPF
jgi:hypothetical protein